MKFKQWFETEYQQPQEKLAEALGTSQANISRWLNGTVPYLHHVLKIQEVSKGKVTAFDFVD